MKKAVKAIPEGYHSLTPYFSVKGALKAIEFYKKAFLAQEVMCMAHEGVVHHAEIKIGDSHLMLADENPAVGNKSPLTLGGSSIGMMLYVEDVDTTVARAVEFGAKITRPVANQFYGDRLGCIEDPFGHNWYVATHIEDLSPEEIAKRAASQVHKD